MNNSDLNNILFNLNENFGIYNLNNNIIISDFGMPQLELTFPSYWNQNRRVRSVQDVIEETMNAKPVFKYIISEEGKKLLKEEEYNINSSNLDSNLCPISLIEFEDKEKLIRLPCNHLFNKENILNWLENEKSECPVCRYQLPSTEIRNQEIDSSNNTIINNYDISNNQFIINVDDNSEDFDDDLDDFIDTYRQRAMLLNSLAMLDNRFLMRRF